MGDVIKLSDYMYPWKEIFVEDNEATTLRVYANSGTAELEINQINEEGEVISTYLSTVGSACLYEALKKIYERSPGKVTG